MNTNSFHVCDTRLVLRVLLTISSISQFSARLVSSSPNQNSIFYSIFRPISEGLGHLSCSQLNASNPSTTSSDSAAFIATVKLRVATHAMRLHTMIFSSMSLLGVFGWSRKASGGCTLLQVSSTIFPITQSSGTSWVFPQCTRIIQVSSLQHVRS